MKLQDLVNRVNTKPDEKKNGALNTYIQNNTQNKGRLDNPVSTLINMLKTPQKSEITDEEFYNDVYKELDGLEYTIEDIDKVANSPKYRGADHDTNTSTIFGLALSALMNKVAEKGDKIQLNMPMSIYYLFYLADGIEAHVNVAGGYLGNSAKNSKIYAEKAANVAGQYMDNCELHVNEAGNYLGNSAKNSKIYAENAGNHAGYNMDNCELYIKNLIGELDGSCFKGKNEIYLGKESYELHPIKYRLRKVKIWEKET